MAQTRIPVKGTKVITKGPKTDSGRRAVAVPPNIAEELAEHVAAYVRPEPNTLMFSKGYQALRNPWDAANRRVCLTYTFHDLSHSGLTWAAAVGATTAELMQRGGHRSARLPCGTNTRPATGTALSPTLWRRWSSAPSASDEH